MASSSKPQLIHLLALLLIFLHLSLHSIVHADPHESDLCNYDDDSDPDDVTPKTYKLDDCVLSSRECEDTWDCGPVCRDMGILNPNAVKCVVPNQAGRTGKRCCCLAPTEPN